MRPEPKERTNKVQEYLDAIFANARSQGILPSGMPEELPDYYFESAEYLETAWDDMIQEGKKRNILNTMQGYAQVESWLASLMAFLGLGITAVYEKEQCEKLRNADIYEYIKTKRGLLDSDDTVCDMMGYAKDSKDYERIHNVLIQAVMVAANICNAKVAKIGAFGSGRAHEETSYAMDALYRYGVLAGLTLLNVKVLPQDNQDHRIIRFSITELDEAFEWINDKFLALEAEEWYDIGFHSGVRWIRVVFPELKMSLRYGQTLYEDEDGNIEDINEFYAYYPENETCPHRFDFVEDMRGLYYQLKNREEKTGYFGTIHCYVDVDEQPVLLTKEELKEYNERFDDESDYSK